MKMSILVPSYNQAAFIRDSLDSILQQTCEGVEVLVIDGGSNDGTKEILASYGSSIRWISEKDGGQADALNKGLHLASGDVIGWLNSDDMYEANIFGDVLSEFRDPAVQWVIGNITTLFDVTGDRTRASSPRISYDELLKTPDIVRQQGAFFRRTFLMSAGAWNKNLQMVMDLDLWLRLSRVSLPKMVDKWWAVFRVQAGQKTSGMNLMKQAAEIADVYREHGVSRGSVYGMYCRKLWYMIKHLAKVGLVKSGLVGERYLQMSLLRREKGHQPIRAAARNRES
jgi:glycosyltransferase involved in cell wall biosynthesis